MKAIMYHYVRPQAEGLPHFRYLALDDFRRQLDHFGEAYGFVDKQEFLEGLDTGRPPEGVVLTFDDAFSDHYDHVFPELTARGLWGVFYVPTGMYGTRKLLDVHRIHLLIGAHGGVALLEALKELVDESMLSHAHVDAFRTVTYGRQENDPATNAVKRILNYFISYEHREAVLDRLMERFAPDEDGLTERFYLTPGQMRTMQDGGMVIGSHSVSHPVFSKLAESDQKREIDASFAFLEEATGGLPFRTFCYPYGGFHSFTDATVRFLEEASCRFAFNVEQRDVEAGDLAGRRQALPRFDCNQFPHGKARFNA